MWLFGYVRPQKAELKIREYEVFRAYYCGVCKSIGSRCGQIPRLVLNYDCAFLALLLSSLNGEKIEIKRERCIAHPIKKRHVVKKSSIIDYASDMNVILAYYNLLDDWKDSRSLRSGTAAVLLLRSFWKLRRKYHEKCGIIETRLKELSLLEKEGCSSIDRAAEPFAKLMEEIMAYEPVCKNDDELKILRWFGYNLGKWIYTIDAYDDMEDDAKNGRYNPFLRQFGYSSEDMNEFKSKIKDRVEFNLTYSLSQISKAFELLNIKNNSGIIDNIVYMGMLEKTEQILGIRSCGKVEESI